MPEIGPAAYIIQLLLDFGISTSGGFGLAPQSWTELYSWSELTARELTPWESETIIQMSRVFVSHHYMYDGKDLPSPYEPETLDREKVSHNVGSFLRMLAARRRGDG